MSETDGRCKDCTFSMNTMDDIPLLHCCRYPPQVFGSLPKWDGSFAVWETIYPRVKFDGWCGEFRADAEGSKQAANNCNPAQAEIAQLRARVAKLKKCLHPAQELIAKWPGDLIPGYVQVQFRLAGVPGGQHCVSVASIRDALAQDDVVTGAALEGESKE